MLLIQQVHVREFHTVGYKQYHLTNEAKARGKKKSSACQTRLSDYTLTWHGVSKIVGYCVAWI